MATHGTTRETPCKNIFNMAAIVMDDISSNSSNSGISGNISRIPLAPGV